MDYVLLTLLKLFVSSALLTGFYFLLFRGKSSYRACRIFLLCIPLLALAFSLVTLKGSHGVVSLSSLLERRTEEIDLPKQLPTERTDTVLEEESLVPVIPEGYSYAETGPATIYAAERPEKSINSGFILFAVYMLVAISIAGIVIRQLVRIRKIRRRAERRVIMNSPTYFSPEIKTSFSVMTSIYVNPKTQEPKLDIIIHHEKQHILHRHYVDLVFMEFFTILMWFNPMIWIIRKELRSVHEFQVDQSVLNEGVQMRSYMLVILEEAAGAIPIMANGLKSSLIKKRFLKMKNGNKIRYRVLRIALTVPFTLTLLVFFAFRSAEKEYSDAKRRAPAVFSDTNEKSAAFFANNETTGNMAENENAEQDMQITAQFGQKPELTTQPEDMVLISSDGYKDERIGILFDSLKHLLLKEYAESGIKPELYNLQNSSDSVWIRAVAFDEPEKTESKPADTVLRVEDAPNLDYAHHGVTVADDGRILDPDGNELDKNVLYSFEKYNAKVVSNKRTFIPGVADRNSFPSKIIRIERSKKETRVTLAVNIYWDSNWLFIDKETYLTDLKTGDRYMVRGIEGDEEVGRMNIIRGLKGRVIEQVLIFPPLPKNVDFINFFETENYTDLPTTTNAGGLRISFIHVDAYDPANRDSQKNRDYVGEERKIIR